uniref:mitogen-activated protein kinase-binding protein 1-like n=1 Tax=Doryrhamphus excisus TaxID=161450 RepID=UPI0025ADCFF8|nr:mitogen-activated protein kinase-binding protein 1-like [Doryrhamphus excisus]
MSADGSGAISRRIKNLLRSPSIKLRGRGRVARRQVDAEVTLEKVLGITAPGNRGLSCDPRTGLLAYPAGCVVVLLHPRKNKQRHIFNTWRKTITTLAFSPDGKHMVTGESGHMPAVRVWEVATGAQVAKLQEHKYGVACVTFSPNSKYIISVGYQHDMMVHVWNWKKDVVVAANKVSSKVTAVSFSHDSSYFVTAGNRHVKFWYLDHSKTSKVNATVPLLGRSGLLGELKNNFFCDVGCGRGPHASSTFCITTSGLLVQFNDRRLLDKWVELQASQATCLCVTDELIFCGCSDGAVRAFSPLTLHFICTLPRPHFLGADVAAMTDGSQLFSCRLDARYPDTVAVTYDPANRWLSCIYNDHSIYVWDVCDLRDPRRVGKLYSALYHASCVWSLEVFPQEGGVGGKEEGKMSLPLGCFLSCSSDNTIRVWNVDGRHLLHANILSHDLHKIIYVDDNLASLLDTDSVSVVAPATSEGSHCDQTRSGIRTLRVSPDGQHLASGDRSGVLRVHDVDTMEEIINVQAHDSEILCLDFSNVGTGVHFLATASRDRLIHVLDAAADYRLVQTLDEHSSSITAVRFTANEDKVRLISCGADKSIYFRTGQQTDNGLEFIRTHHVARKTTLYDMDVEPTRKYAAIGCQDRSIRIFNVNNSKQKKIYKGSQGEDGTLIKVQIDPSGLYIATSCSDKSINIFDFYSGECVAAMFGHSEVVTGLKFTSDCSRLISVSGDSCIFVWRLSPEMTLKMRQRLADLRPSTTGHVSHNAPQQRAEKLRETECPRAVAMSSDSDEEEEGVQPGRLSKVEEEEAADMSHDRNTSYNTLPSDGRLPRRRWSRKSGGAGDVLAMNSMLDLRQLETGAETLTNDGSPRGVWAAEAGLQRANQQRGSSISLQVEHLGSQTNQRPDFMSPSNQSPEKEEQVLFPDQWEDRVSLSSDFEVKETASAAAAGQQDKPSPDSGCSLRFNSRTSSPDPGADNSDHTEHLSENGDSLDEEEDAGPVPQTPDQEAFLKKHFVTLADIAEGPSRTSHSSSESLSISSRFLSQNSAASRAVPWSQPRSETRDVKACPLVSEVHPLRDQNQDQKESFLEDAVQNLHPSPGKKEAECKRNVVFQPDTSSRLQKSQSVQSLLSDPGRVSPLTSPSTGGVTPQRPTSLPSGPRRPIAAAPPPQRSSPASPRVSDQENVAMTTPRKSSSPSVGAGRSYMSPTTSSMAKMSRSVSLGEALNEASLDSSAGAGFSCLVASDTPPATPPQAAIAPVVVGSSFSSLSCRGNQAATHPRFLHTRLPGAPLPDKPTITSFSPFAKPAPSGRPPVSTPPLTPPLLGEAPQAGGGGGVEPKDDADQPMSVEACRALTNEMLSCFKRAAHLYRKVSSSRSEDATPERGHMVQLLSEAFQDMRAELQSLPLGAAGGGRLLEVVGQERTTALLEEYSHLLLQAVHRKLRPLDDA